MQRLIFFMVLSAISLIGVFFVRFQFKKIHEIIPSPEERKSEFIAFLLGVGVNFLGIGLYESLGTLKFPTYASITQPLTPVSIRTMILGALFGTLVLGLIRIALVRRKTSLQSSALANLSRVAWIALTVALTLELSIFNLRHYDMLLRTDLAPTTVTRGSFELQGLTFDEATQQYSSIPDYEGTPRLTVRFDPVKVHTIQLNFSTDRPVLYASIFVADEAFRYEKVPSPIQLTSALPRSLFLPIHSIGESPYFTLIFSSIPQGQSVHFRLDSVVLNAEMPLRFEIPRVLFAAILAFFFLLVRPNGWLGTLRFDPKSRLQNAMTSGILILMIIGFAYIIDFNHKFIPSLKYGFKDGLEMYNQDRPTKSLDFWELTDAFLAGQVHLLDPADESILAAEYPYDETYRKQFGVISKIDRVFYQGKYYSYFGAVPVLLTFLPFKALTGINMPLEFALMIFSIMAILGLRKLLTFLFRIYFPSSSFSLYLLSLVSVIAASQIPCLIRSPFVYQVAVQVSIAFSIWAVYWMFKGVKGLADSADSPAANRSSVISAFFGSGLCAGLAVGSRPTTMFTLIWLFTIALQLRSVIKSIPKGRLLSAFLAFAVPISAIAGLLMLYNALRFGSIFEFGFKYQLTGANENASGLRVSPIGMIFSIFAYLFQPLAQTFDFPFIALSGTVYPPYLGHLELEGVSAGLIAFPWFWGLALLKPYWDRFRKSNLTAPITGAWITSGIMIVIASTVGIFFRYLMDATWILSIPALLGWLTWVGADRDQPDIYRSYGFYFIAAMMVFIAIFLSYHGDTSWYPTDSAVQLQRLRYLYSFWL